MSDTNMSMVLSALKKAGLNDNQARIMAAEIGRENGFRSDLLWGYHYDPKNKAKNIGLISWQGNRATKLEQRLKAKGLIRNGKMVRSQEALDEQARFLVDEIRTISAYSKTKKLFLDNPNVDYATGNKVLGTNFIRWAYTSPKYASGHKNRDMFYKKLGGIVAADGTTSSSGSEQTQTQTPTLSNPYQITAPTISTPTNPIDSLGLNVDPTTGVGSTVLNGPMGLTQAENKFEQNMFDNILKLNLDAESEKVQVSATQTISAALNKLRGGNMISNNPLMDFVSDIFNGV